MRSTLHDFQTGQLDNLFSRGNRRGAGRGRAGFTPSFNRGSRGTVPEPLPTGVVPSQGLNWLANTWIWIHLAVAALAFVVCYLLAQGTLLSRARTGGGGTDRIMQTKGGVVVSHTVCIPFAQGIPFRVNRRSAWDDSFRLAHLSWEFQTGDKEFDRQFYVEADNKQLRSTLTTNGEIRRVITEMFRKGSINLWSDGALLYLQVGRDMRGGGQSAGILQLKDAGADDLRSQALAALEQMRRTVGGRTGRFVDTFAERSRVLYAVAGAAVVSAAFAGIESVSYGRNVHLDQVRLAVDASVVAVLFLSALLLSTFALLRQSTRRHRVLLRVGLAVLIAAPLVGFQVVSDMNRGLDRGEPQTVSARVMGHWQERHRRGKRGGYYYTYHAGLSAPSSPVALPASLEVSASVYLSLRDGAIVPIAIGPGALGVPWLRSINGVPVS